MFVVARNMLTVVTFVFWDIHVSKSSRNTKTLRVTMTNRVRENTTASMYCGTINKIPRPSIMRQSTSRSTVLADIFATDPVDDVSVGMGVRSSFSQSGGQISLKMRSSAI